MFDDKKCEVCGQPATKAARDVVEDYDSPEGYRALQNGFKQYKGGKLHFWCDFHAPASEFPREQPLPVSG